MDNTAFFNLTYGVYLCTTWDEGRPTGCVANSAMQVTSDPATIAVSINHDNYTNACIKKCGYFAIAVLAEDSDPKLIGKFGFLSGKDTDKFDGVPYAVRGQLPVPDGGMTWFACKVVSATETGTHTLFLGEVTDAGNLRKAAPMTYAYYHKVLKGKTAAKAPTYVEGGEPKGEEKYVCGVCSYEYNGDVPFEELPDDWVCPLCGMGKEFFVKVGADGKKRAAANEKWVCKVCGYVYDGDTPFEELPESWVCPICGMGKDQFEKVG